MKCGFIPWLSIGVASYSFQYNIPDIRHGLITNIGIHFKQ